MTKSRTAMGQRVIEGPATRHSAASVGVGGPVMPKRTGVSPCGDSTHLSAAGGRFRKTDFAVVAGSKEASAVLLQPSVWSPKHPLEESEDQPANGDEPELEAEKQADGGKYHAAQRRTPRRVSKHPLRSLGTAARSGDRSGQAA